MAQSICQDIWGSPKRRQYVKEVNAAKRNGSYPSYAPQTGQPSTVPVPRHERDAVKDRIAAYKAAVAHWT